MTTTCQQIIDRAKSFSAMNAPLASDPAEMMTRIRSIQQRVFTTLAQLAHVRFSATSTINSTNAAAARVVDLSGVTPPIERLIQATISTGTLNPVSERDTEAKLAPRFFVRGQSLIEVGSDWGATGVVAVTILYVYGATALAPSDSPSSKNVSVPDEWIDVIVLPLAMYLHQKDPGRDPAEFTRLSAMYGQAWDVFMDYLVNYPGYVENRRLMIPPPDLQPTTRLSA